MYACMINMVKMSHGGLNMFFLSASSDSGLHCAQLNSEHAIPDLSPHPSKVHIFSTSAVIQVQVSSQNIGIYWLNHLLYHNTKRVVPGRTYLFMKKTMTTVSHF